MSRNKSAILGYIVTLLIFLIPILFAAGAQNEKIEQNKTEIEEQKENIKTMSITLHKRLSTHEKEQKQDFKEVKKMLNSIYYKVK